MDSDGEMDIVEQAERTALEEVDGIEGDNEENQENQEVQREVNEDDVEEVQADGNEDDDTVRRVIKPKRVVRNPQPKLNADTLRGSRGLTALPPLFAKQKFKGKGHEETDLNVILKTYQYWCHRLFPKMRFDQCVEKLETLGNKKPVMTYVKRIRMGLLDEEPPEPRTVVSDDEAENTAPTAQQQQQIESVEARFDSFAQRPKDPELELTDEQKEIIRVNKERAMKLREERLRRIQEQAGAKLGVSSVLPSQQEDIQSLPESQSHDNEDFMSASVDHEIHDITTQKVTSQTKDKHGGFDDDDDDDAFMSLSSQIPEQSAISSEKSKEQNNDNIGVDEFLDKVNDNELNSGSTGMDVDCANVQEEKENIDDGEEIGVDEFLNNLVDETS